MGFKNDEEIPLMKEVRKQFFKLSIEKHPDKNDGIDKGFGELKNAFDTLCTYINENVEFDNKDEEESLARKQFQEANIITINTNCITIKVSSSLIPFYDKALEEELGTPIDSSKSNNGIRCNLKDEVYITTYHKKKESNSTIHVQGIRYIEFVDKSMP